MFDLIFILQEIEEILRAILCLTCSFRMADHLLKNTGSFLARKWDCEYFAYLQKFLKVKLFGVLKHRIERYEIFIIPINVFFGIKLENGVKLFFRTGYFSAGGAGLASFFIYIETARFANTGRNGALMALF